VTFFGWPAALGKIVTMNNFCERHVIVIDWCCLCKRDVEFVDRLLLNCEVACAIWNVFFSRFGLSWGCMLVGGLLATLEVLLCGR